MDTKDKLILRLLETDKSLKESAIVIPISFNLKPDASDDRAAGLIAVTADSVITYTDGEKTSEIKTDKITEFILRIGIGCVFIEYKTDDEARILCRSDMRDKDAYAAIVKELNRYKTTGSIREQYEEDLMTACPKCGRPFRPGSKICDHCTKKSGYLKRVWDLAKPWRVYIYISVVLFFVTAGLNLLTPYLNRVLVDDYIKAEDMPELAKFVVVILSIVAVNVIVRVISTFRNFIMIIAGNKVIVKLRELVFNKTQMLSIARISKRTAGELMNRVTDDTSVLQQFITREFGDMFEQVIIFLTVSIYLFVEDWRLALLILLPAPFVSMSFRFFWGFMSKMFDKQWTTNSQARTILHDIFSGIRVVKAFGMEKRETERYDKITREERDIAVRNEIFFARVFPALSFFMGIGEFFLMYYAGSRILSGEMTLGQMAQFSAYVGIIYGPLRWITSFPRRIVRVMTSIVKIYDIIDEEVDVDDSATAVDMDIEGYIDFDNASFGYDNTTNVLKNISLHIEPGEMVGIVGKSGVGKSTLINLVMRMYDVEEGCIKIDGVNIKDISQASLRSQIGVVLQETFLFSGTIYDNIAYAKPGATRDEVITSAKIAGAHSFIMKLPDAYNTKVGERGHTLSGGERQRVAIARALLHNPRILILDEATASLDTETEKQIQDSLQKLIADRTTLAIAHRLSTLRNATKIIVLDKGQVAEVGTHEQLIQAKGIYYGLVMAQRQMSKMSPKNTEI
jgi:ABC-type multidrug transport system, ATPase and permease components